MNINKITKLKDNKYKILIDSEAITTYDNVILENELLYKKTIDSKLYKKIIKDTDFYDIYNKTVKYIMKRLRSEQEIREYLSKYDVDKEKIITKLKSINLINDNAYLKAYINDQIYLSKNGIYKIKEYLLNQNISSELIDNELSKIDSSIMDERLERIVLKRIRTNKKYSTNELRNRVLKEVITLGYSREKAMIIFDNNIIEDSNIIEKEYNKLYSKLSIKYSGYELINKIKQKLYSKGFTIDEINNLLQNKTED